MHKQLRQCHANFCKLKQVIRWQDLVVCSIAPIQMQFLTSLKKQLKIVTWNLEEQCSCVALLAKSIFNCKICNSSIVTKWHLLIQRLYRSSYTYWYLGLNWQFIIWKKVIPGWQDCASRNSISSDTECFPAIVVLFIAGSLCHSNTKHSFRGTATFVYCTLRTVTVKFQQNSSSRDKGIAWK